MKEHDNIGIANKKSKSNRTHFIQSNREVAFAKHGSSTGKNLCDGGIGAS